MQNIVIEIKELSKQYFIGRNHKELKFRTIRDSISSSMKAPIRRAGKLLRGKLHRAAEPKRKIWALKDVSLNIREGEVLGIIGRNGAGKSTLLKILSRITEPTKGWAKIYGRIGSLLEVGTGFHPELTGRENIYLNGSILGMKRKEIEKNFDEIVSFAEIDKFIDTPVKHYSSGMYVRLAFSVAAHLEPEILIVDEVLSVGDIVFQKKCLGKMGEVAQKGGRTILFVSHNLTSIQALCQNTMWLEMGKVVEIGKTPTVVHRYLESMNSNEVVPIKDRLDRPGDGSVRITSIQIQDLDNSSVIRVGSRLKISIAYSSKKPVNFLQVYVTINDLTDTHIFALDSNLVGGFPQKLPSQGLLICQTDPINLTPGRCYAAAELYRGNTMADLVTYAAYFDVETDDFYKSGRIPERRDALCTLQHEWFLCEKQVELEI